MPDLLARFKQALADRYRVDREIGRGGMARVFLAYDLKLDRPVALKVLRPDLAAVLGGEQFLHEIMLAAKLDHPHILPVHDAGEADGILYYAMPYVEGESLRDRLIREKQLPVDEALQISREVADALSYAHAHGVIHRDIKPENILLEAGHAVVVDFGIARAMHVAGRERPTETEVPLGTPAYMSPEQASGDQDLDERSDLYSLGCVLYEMLAGQPPFLGPTTESVRAQHLSASVPDIATIRPSVPNWAVAALQRSLAKTPADRYGTGTEFAEAIAPWGAAGVAPEREPAARKRWPWERMALIGVAAAVVIAGAVLVRRGQTPGTHPRTAIAVLPFQNLSAEGPYGYFAGGLHDELITQLTRVAALTVMGRTSVMGYAGTTKPVEQIADELGVGSLVEASIQVVGDRLHVNVQLLDGRTGAHRWAESYDRTLEDAFAVQSDIARHVVSAVGAALTGAEASALATSPTTNAEAYRLYLQGQEYWRRPGLRRQDFASAQRLYEQAIACDSTFALAHAALSVLHGYTSWLQYDVSPDRLVHQRAEAEIALRLAPALPQAHVAMGVVYSVAGDLSAAADEYGRALRGQPNDADTWARIAATARRLGKWNEAIAAYEKATQLEPRNADWLRDLGGNTLATVRRYAAAIEAYRRAAALAPDLATQISVRIGEAYVSWKGSLDTLRAALEKVPRDSGVAAWAGLLLDERQPDSLLALLKDAPADAFEGRNSLRPTQLYVAWAYQLWRDHRAARTAFDSARVLLDSVALRVGEDDWRLHAARGLVFAGLGRRQRALEEARWLEGVPQYRDAYFNGTRFNRARILAQASETDAALRAIEWLLSSADFTVHNLRLEPVWDPIRTDPRFQALLKKYDPPLPLQF